MIELKDTFVSTVFIDFKSAPQHQLAATRGQHINIVVRMQKYSQKRHHSF